MRSGAFGHSLGAACGIAEVCDEEPVTAARLAAGSFEVDVAGERYGVRLGLKAPLP